MRQVRQALNKDEEPQPEVDASDDDDAHDLDHPDNLNHPQEAPLVKLPPVPPPPVLPPPHPGLLLSEVLRLLGVAVLLVHHEPRPDRIQYNPLGVRDGDEQPAAREADGRELPQRRLGAARERRVPREHVQPAVHEPRQAYPQVRLEGVLLLRDAVVPAAGEVGHAIHEGVAHRALQPALEAVPVLRARGVCGCCRRRRGGGGAGGGRCVVGGRGGLLVRVPV